MAGFPRCLLCGATFLSTAVFLHPTHRCNHPTTKDETNAPRSEPQD